MAILKHRLLGRFKLSGTFGVRQTVSYILIRIFYKVIQSHIDRNLCFNVKKDGK